MQRFQVQIDKKDEELNKLKNDIKNKNFPNDLHIKDSDILTINFISSDQKIKFTIQCDKNTIFAEVEEKLYKIYSEYRETNNIFVVNGNQVLRFKTIEQNKIKNGNKIMLLNRKFH